VAQIFSALNVFSASPRTIQANPQGFFVAEGVTLKPTLE
jgi:hypothetical protein